MRMTASEVNRRMADFKANGVVGSPGLADAYLGEAEVDRRFWNFIAWAAQRLSPDLGEKESDDG